MEQKRQLMAQEGSRRIWLLAWALLLGACASIGTPSKEPTPTTTLTTSSRAVALYFVADTANGFRLYREFHRVPKGDDAIVDALNALFADAPLDPDYSNLWPKSTSLNMITRSGNVATIDLSYDSLNVGAESELRAIDQIVWTATAADTSIKKVSFLRDGKPIESFAGHVDTLGTFAREATYEVLAPVWITSVEQGGTVKTPLTFGGLAQTFEANVQWQILQQRKIVKQGATTAGEAAPARTPWKVTIADLVPGSYTIRAFTSSAKDGSLVAADTKEINLVKS